MKIDYTKLFINNIVDSTTILLDDPQNEKSINKLHSTMFGYFYALLLSESKKENPNQEKVAYLKQLLNDEKIILKVDGHIEFGDGLTTIIENNQDFNMGFQSGVKATQKTNTKVVVKVYEKMKDFLATPKSDLKGYRLHL